jgi:hypothetical protein
LGECVVEVGDFDGESWGGEADFGVHGEVAGGSGSWGEGMAFWRGSGVELHARIERIYILQQPYHADLLLYERIALLNVFLYGDVDLRRVGKRRYRAAILPCLNRLRLSGITDNAYVRDGRIRIVDQRLFLMKDKILATRAGRFSGSVTMGVDIFENLVPVAIEQDAHSLREASHNGRRVNSYLSAFIAEVVTGFAALRGAVGGDLETARHIRRTSIAHLFSPSRYGSMPR